MPNYLSHIIKEANRRRNKRDEEEEKQEMIEIREDLLAKINSEPFFSSKIVPILIHIETKGRGLALLKIKTKIRKPSKKRKRFELATTYEDFKNKEAKNAGEELGRLPGKRRKLNEMDES